MKGLIYDFGELISTCQGCSLCLVGRVKGTNQKWKDDLKYAPLTHPRGKPSDCENPRGIGYIIS